MTHKNQFRRSGTRLQRQGTLCFQQTRNASETFLAESRNAGVTFGQEMRAASAKLVASTGRAAKGLQKALHKEALDWRDLVLQTRDAYIAAIEARLEDMERQALSTRNAFEPGKVEKAILQSARDLLERAQSRVEERLGQVAKPAKLASAKPVSKPKAAKGAAKKGQSPLRNYDRLTAKDLVSRVQRLSAPQTTAVLDYERARKKRATVIKAAEQRLAAAS